MRSYYKERWFKNKETVAIFKKKYPTPFTEELHTHDFIEIVYILSGSGKQQIDDKTYDVSSGSLLFINYGQTHAFTSEDMLYYNLMIKPEAVSSKIISTNNAFEILSLTAFEEFKDADTTCPFIEFTRNTRLSIERIFDEMHKEYTAAQAGYQTILGGYLTVLLAHIFRAMLPMGKPVNTIPIEITQYIEKHFNEKLTLEHLAEKCFFSPKYFSRIFKECFGITVSEYIKKTRLESAKTLLEETQYTIEDISKRVGYEDTAKFYKYFKELYGITPREYKKNIPDNIK